MDGMHFSQARILGNGSRRRAAYWVKYEGGGGPLFRGVLGPCRVSANARRKLGERVATAERFRWLKTRTRKNGNATRKRERKGYCWDHQVREWNDINEVL